MFFVFKSDANCRGSISYEKIQKYHFYSDMRECFISPMGILFKISHREYYYISFGSIQASKEEVIAFLKLNFHQKIRIRTEK